MNNKVIIQHDDDGFLVGKRRVDSIENRVNLTYDNTQAILKAVKGKVQSNGRRIVVSGRLKLDSSGAAAVKNTVKGRSNRPRSTAARASVPIATGSAEQAVTQAATAHPLMNQGERQKSQQFRRQERRHREAVSKSNQVQEKLLKDINKNLKNGKKGGLLSKLLPLLGFGALMKGGFKLPLAMGAAAASLLGLRKGKPPVVAGNRDAKGRYVAGWHGAMLSQKPTLMSRAMRGLGRGGALAALWAAFDGVGVENSNMDRADKNKAHFKNFFAAGGGVAGAAGGAAAGAAIGSVVPVIGTAVGAVIGGVLGGVGGSTLADYFIEQVDKAIDPDLSRMMFGSWKGFINTLNMGAYNVWNMLIPASVHKYFDKLGIDSTTFYTTITGLATTFWTETGVKAAYVWDTYVPKEVRAFFSTLGDVAKLAFDDFRKGFNRLFEAIAQTPAGQSIGDAWQWAKDTAGNAWNATKKAVGVGGDGGVYDSQKQKANDAARRSGWDSVQDIADNGAQAVKKTAQQAFVASKETTKAADYAMRHALPKSASQCALYVNNALRAQGVKIWGHGRDVAKNLINSKQGFTQVKYDENYVPQDGDVMSMPSNSKSKHNYGHVGIYNKKKNRWVSDFVQPVYGNNSTAAASQQYWKEIQSGKIVPTIARKGSYQNVVSGAESNKIEGVNSFRSKAFTAEKAASIARVAQNIGVNPNDLAAVISFETAGTFNPAMKNPKSSATGLIQFMKGSGGTAGRYYGMTREQFANLSFDQQMQYVERYFKERDKRFRAGNESKNTVADVYGAVTGYGYKRGTKAYDLNKVWDSDRDGIVEKGEMVQNGAFKAHQRKYFDNKAVSKIEKPILLNPTSSPIVKSNAQEIALNRAKALKTANIQPQEIKAIRLKENKTDINSGLLAGAGFGAQIAHAPIKRQVSHHEIASITSGGTGA